VDYMHARFSCIIIEQLPTQSVRNVAVRTIIVEMLGAAIIIGRATRGRGMIRRGSQLEKVVGES
jgi:hypothetical protein